MKSAFSQLCFRKVFPIMRGGPGAPTPFFGGIARSHLMQYFYIIGHLEEYALVVCSQRGRSFNHWPLIEAA
jgi:hypothetical protein